MNETINLMKKYINQPIEGITVELSEKTFLFALKPFEAKKNRTNLRFLKELYQFIDPGYKYDENGSGIYFFKAGNSVIELDIHIDETIEITPYLCYLEESIQQDFERIVHVDYLLYCVLKKYELQS